MATNPYFPQHPEASSSAPPSRGSSRASSPLGLQMAPLHSAPKQNLQDIASEQLNTPPWPKSEPNIRTETTDDPHPSTSSAPGSPLQVPRTVYFGPSSSSDNESVSKQPFPDMTRSSIDDENNNELRLTDSARRKGQAMQSAYERAQRLASRVHRPSFVRKKDTKSPSTTAPSYNNHNTGGNGDAIIELDDMDDTFPGRPHNSGTSEASAIVRSLTRPGPPSPSTSFRASHLDEERPASEEAGSRREFRGGILFHLLKLSQNEEGQRRVSQHVPPPSPLPLYSPQSEQAPSGINTPRSKPKWYDKSRNVSSSSLSQSRNVSASSLSTLLPDAASPSTEALKTPKGGSNVLAAAAKKLLPRQPPAEDRIAITVHIADILSRQRYLVKLCQALMKYGAPTHRLEEYMSTTARVLGIDAEFLYLPGCMFFSFGDATTHTTELKLLKYPQGVDLGRLADVHEVYKEVVHDVIGVEEAMQTLEEIIRRKNKYNKWWLIFFYGCASASVGPFAFEAGALDIPISFLLGCILGAMNYILVPRSPLYSNVFELTAVMVTSFLARAIGSIRGHSGETSQIFCFPALAQSSIALILPGYMVLCASLELQSRNMLAGSVRLVYAVIYSLVLGFGMMLGTTFYGSIDPYASSAYACSGSMRFVKLNEYARKFPSVILFTLCLTMINQAKWRQAPVMIIISLAGYVVNFFASKRFPNNTQIASSLGAFAIGVLGNLYSRLGRGLAAAAILPAIFVQVPSGLASSGSLISGLAFANEVTRNRTGVPQTSRNATDSVMPSDIQGLMGGASGTFGADYAKLIGANKLYGNIVFDLAYGMVQVSIGITVGLFLAALVVYPLGKRRSGLFSF